MAITLEKLEATMREVKRFIDTANKAKTAIKGDPNGWAMLPKEKGAVRRASMDLTRSLAELRRS